VLLTAKLLFPSTADIYMWIYLWQLPSLNRGRKTKPKKRNEESKLLLPQLEVCVVRVGGICTGCEGWGGGWWMWMWMGIWMGMWMGLLCGSSCKSSSTIQFKIRAQFAQCKAPGGVAQYSTAQYSTVRSPCVGASDLS